MSGIRRRMSVVLVAVVAAVCGPAAGTAGAAVVFDGSPGTGPPPGTLGPFSMTPFGNDTRANNQVVTTVPGPTGDITFDQQVSHTEVGDEWATWSNGYTGDVYHTKFLSGPQQRVLTLPPNTSAFYFYAEPDNTLGNQIITATAQDGTSSGPVSVNGNAGARYYGFYGTGGSQITSITVTTDDPDAFAVGEFGINNTGPEPPQVGQSGTVEPVSGTVRIQEPGGQFRVLQAGDTIPNNSIVDTTLGRVELTTELPDGSEQSMQFYDGRFVFKQKAGTGLVDLQLNRTLTCSNSSGKGEDVSKRRRRRRLWGRGRGRHRTRGRRGSASVRGTWFLTEDTCKRTTFRVKEGQLEVRDPVNDRTVTVDAGESYTIRNP